MRQLSIALVLGAFLCMTGWASAAGPEVGQPAPEFKLADIEGQTRQLTDYRGTIVVLHFQAIHCPWERAYQPLLSDLAKKYAEGEKPVQFLAINANVAESVDELKAFNEKERIPYPILKDTGNKVADLYAARTTPHIYVVDAEGLLRYKGGVEKAPTSPGGATKSSEPYLEPVLAALVEGKEPPVTDTRSIGCGIKRAKKSSAADATP